MNNFIAILLCIFVSVCIFLILVEIDVSFDKNFHEVLNPKLYNENTFIIKKNKEMEKRIKKGKKIASSSSIVICTLARNISKLFEKNSKRLEYIGEKFNKYGIVIFENDSDDGSRKKLSDWEQKNSNVVFLRCCDMQSCDCVLKKKKGYDLGAFSKNRMSNMGFYRNRYLDYVKKNYSSYDYLLVMDFDLDGIANLDGLYDSLGYDCDWDAIFINGHNPVFGTFGLLHVPYDALAYVDINDDNHNSLSIAYNYFNMVRKTYLSDKLIPVKSAFNGYGLYKIGSIKKCSYTGDSNCEHINLALCMHNNGNKLFINPEWRGYFNLQGPGGIIQILSSTNNSNEI